MGRHDPEGEARPEVRGRDVELRVRSEDLHDLVAVETERLAHSTDLVRKAHLQCVEGVVDVLGHLCDADRHTIERPWQAVVEAGQHVAAPVAKLADHGLGRRKEVADGTAFSKELGIHADAEVDARFHGRGLLEAGAKLGLASARQHGGAKGHHVPRGRLREPGADLVRHTEKVIQGDRAGRRGWGADADQSEVSRGDRSVDIGSGRQAPLPHGTSNEVTESVLDHGSSTSVDHPHLVEADVDPDHLVAALGKARRRHGADVAKTEDGDARLRAQASGGSLGEGRWAPARTDTRAVRPLESIVPKQACRVANAVPAVRPGSPRTQRHRQ